MITEVLMPQLGLEVTEGTVVELLVAVGAAVAKDEPLITLSTDKADTDVTAPAAGIVREIRVELGETVPVGAVLALIADTADEPLDGAPAADGGTAAAAPSAEEPVAAPVTTVPAAEAPAAATARVRASPVARRAAREHGIALESIAGTGPRGRIVLDDVRIAAASAPAGAPTAAPATTPAAPGEVEIFSPIRRAIARRMALSQREVPQYQLVREVDATHLLAQKDAAASAVQSGARPGVNDLLIQAIAEALARHPDVAAVFVDGDEPGIRRPSSIDVGLAVATDRGLVVPVVRGAHVRPLRELAADRARLVDDARAGRLKLEDMTGGTTTLSNLGGFGIDRFTAMVNPGESSIVAVGRVVDRLVPRGRGIAVQPSLAVTMSFDHRVVDGAVGAAALAELADLLEGGMPWRV
ncbi:unannotated protein [freshwater metagenome]|uniref:Unannotated protein n=1 Tax=freshwater metagenome TaxID=449393 RepID=A0A6J7JD81_9ZZZZ|nr:dihydrolipoamide acetyltransferase [Actinomycetota bacterium]